VERRFQNVFPDSLSFENLNLPNKMLSLNKALQEQNSERIHQYALLLANHSFHPDWFDVYEAAIHELAWSGNIDCAKKWLTSVSSLDLRNRYLERLNEQKDWINFTQNNKIVAD
ncbi:MAG TPA: hypothetical protein DD671_11815, partial [Balneolaceae bacterium]|nr:hypothetical protein [Balneolaceae bacterium]